MEARDRYIARWYPIHIIYDREGGRKGVLAVQSCGFRASTNCLYVTENQKRIKEKYFLLRSDTLA